MTHMACNLSTEVNKHLHREKQITAGILRVSPPSDESMLVRKLSIRKQKLNISGIFACQRKLLVHVHSKQAEERTSITQLQHFYSFLQLPATLQNLWSNAVSKSHLIY